MQPLTQHTNGLQSLQVPGIDGVIPGIPAYLEAPNITIIVQTPIENLEALYALFMQPNAVLSKTADPSKSVGFEYVSSSYVQLGPADSLSGWAFVLRLDGAVWRDANENPFDAAYATTTTLQFWEGMSAAVGDAVIQMVGPATGPIALTDVASGNGVTWSGSLAATDTFSYDMASMTATYAPGGANAQDVSGELDFIGLDFRLTPYFPDPTDPTTRYASLRVNTGGGTTSASTIEIQGRAAYIV
jgi:hypothetical protein